MLSDQLGIDDIFTSAPIHQLEEITKIQAVIVLELAWFSIEEELVLKADVNKSSIFKFLLFLMLHSIRFHYLGAVIKLNIAKLKSFFFFFLI